VDASGTKDLTQSYQIVPMTALHIKPLSKVLRAAACMTLEGFGFHPREALRRAFVASMNCRVALVDGKPAAAWGVKATLLGDTAFVWLVLSDAIAAIPRAILREAKAELARIMEGYREIAITVLPDDIAAVRFAVALGFHDRENDDGHLSRKEMTDAILTDPQYKIPVGDAYVIAMGFHPSHGHA
jgi:hypothetical protein